MTWFKALHEYWNTFMTAYPENNVPEDTVFPWLTYPVNRGMFNEDTVGTVHLHFWTESEATPNEMVDMIAKSIQSKEIECDEGIIILNTGTPTWIPINDDNNRNHKHRIINVSMSWLLTR